MILIEEESKFVDNLNFQIAQKDSFLKKIPKFQKQINLLDFKLGLKESILSMKKNFEATQRRSAYQSIVDELDYLIKKHNKNK